jgi:hypothetical protein
MEAAVTPGAPGSEFDAFLYASIAEEHNGTLLSVLSALARLNLDPWDEAARLAGLPRAAASQILTKLIAALPEGPSASSDPEALAERLMALLPKRAASTGRSAAVEAQRAATASYARTAAWALYISALLFMLVNQWLSDRPHPHTTPASGATSSAPGAISPHAPSEPPAR